MTTGIISQPLMGFPRTSYLSSWTHDLTHSASQLRIFSILAGRDEMASNSSPGTRREICEPSTIGAAGFFQAQYSIPLSTLRQHRPKGNPTMRHSLTTVNDCPMHLDSIGLAQSSSAITIFTGRME